MESRSQKRNAALSKVRMNPAVPNSSHSIPNARRKKYQGENAVVDRIIFPELDQKEMVSSSDIRAGIHIRSARQKPT
jgi:hypothetical protein